MKDRVLITISILSLLVTFSGLCVSLYLLFVILSDHQRIIHLTNTIDGWEEVTK